MPSHGHTWSSGRPPHALLSASLVNEDEDFFLTRPRLRSVPRGEGRGRATPRPREAHALHPASWLSSLLGHGVDRGQGRRGHGGEPLSPRPLRTPARQLLSPRGPGTEAGTAGPSASREPRSSPAWLRGAGGVALLTGRAPRQHAHVGAVRETDAHQPRQPTLEARKALPEEVTFEQRTRGDCQLERQGERAQESPEERDECARCHVGRG